MKSTLSNNLKLIDSMLLVKPEVTFVDIAIIFDILGVSYENAVEAFEKHFDKSLDQMVKKASKKK
jgi:hypothetical protein